MVSIFNFSNSERRTVAFVLLALFTLLFFNYKESLRKSRDAQRKADIRDITNLVGAFQEKYGFIPDTKDGKIVACNRLQNEAGGFNYFPCDWGKEYSEIGKLPIDPTHQDGRGYVYLSDGKRFQIFASLEGKKEAEYDTKIEARALKCGNSTCNFGLSTGSTPLNISLEEYEQQLDKERKKK